MSIALKIENISKAYQLGTIGTGSLARDIERWWALSTGKKDPFLKIGEPHERQTMGNNRVVWSLKDINFDIHQGDIVGIIGRNGAGKSTLLKILSRITAPTTGSIKAKGRIASLLEVGTGFHPELTGRENIYLNGAILGMRRKEINKKLDEIIAFSGVDKYIDTPVKRFSSGMYVRLAFAVAAHLDSEILIVDEVLAVGDAEFQKKCLGKMGEISKGEGRTVLFVSHAMESVEKLCNQCLLLESGALSKIGNVTEVIKHYQKRKFALPCSRQFENEQCPGNDFAKIREVSILNNKQLVTSSIPIDEHFYVLIRYEDCKAAALNTALIHVKDEKENVLFAAGEFNSPLWESKKVPGITTALCKIPANFLAEGSYTVLAAIGHYNPNMTHILLDDIVSFTITETYSGQTVRKDVTLPWPGLVRPLLNWEIKSK